jgi:hypothetical protein
LELFEEYVVGLDWQKWRRLLILEELDHWLVIHSNSYCLHLHQQHLLKVEELGRGLR